MLLSADVKDGFVAIHGWQTVTDWQLTDFIREYLQLGVTTVVCTDIAKDGMMAGPSFSLYEKMMALFPDLKLIASGGIFTPQQALEKLKAGADLVQLYTGFIYEGPALVKAINKELLNN